MRPGRVSLVGAGPGDPGLITLKGLRRVESADVVVHDRLVDKRLLGRARPDAELIDGGKTPGEGGYTQEDINRLLVDRARQGADVVRLKGGDPFVFGRGGEEAEALSKAGVPFEVVPGVTSAIAGPAYAGIPVTHRGVSSSFAVVTGSDVTGSAGDSFSSEGLARHAETLVVLMGWDNLRVIVDALIGQGRPPDTPVALVHWATEPYQQTVVGTLSDIVRKATDAGLSAPVVAVFGDVVELSQRLQWFENRPLFGKRVLVTRTRSQARALSDLLTERGAAPIDVPTIEIRPPDDFERVDRALRRLHSYDWVVFTSANAVRAVFDRLYGLGLDARALGSARVAAVGPATAGCLKECGIVADFVPEEFLPEAMIDGLKGRLKGSKVLLPVADIAREAISEGLTALGAEVERLVVYRTVVPEASARAALELLSDGIDVATFTSSSTVRNLASLLDGDLGRLRQSTIACIGPITADAAREVGLKVDIIASEHTVAGLVDALEAYCLEENAGNG